MANRPQNWGYVATATPLQPTPIQIPRGRVTGGSSAINGQVLFRGLPEDYDAWAAWGNDEWAFTKVLPYFRKLETDLDYPGGDFHGSDGPSRCAATAGRSGCPTRGPSTMPALPWASPRTRTRTIPTPRASPPVP